MDRLISEEAFRASVEHTRGWLVSARLRLSGQWFGRFLGKWTVRAKAIKQNPSWHLHCPYFPLPSRWLLHYHWLLLPLFSSLTLIDVSFLFRISPYYFLLNIFYFPSCCYLLLWSRTTKNLMAYNNNLLFLLILSGV